ncbi:MAG: DNA polymerase III subunit delta [Pseudobdellovibrionaceae bacterium]
MAMREAQRFYTDLDRKVFDPVYFLFGEEAFFIDEALLRIKKSVLLPQDMDFNYTQFSAKDNEIEQILDEAITLPVFIQKRLVVVQNTQDFTDKEMALLVDYVKNPSESAVLVLIASKIDKRKKAMKSLIDLSICIEFRKPFDYQIPQWIKYLAQKEDLKITDEAKQLLHRLVGSNLLELQAEMTKLKDFLGDRKSIEVQDVAAVVSSSKEESIFQFTQALGELNLVTALETLVKLMDQGQNEIGIIAMVARHIRILLFVKRGEKQGLFGAKLAEYAKVPHYFLDEYLAQTRLWSNGGLLKTLQLLSETDFALRASPTSSHIWIENLVLQTCKEQPITSV